MCGILGGNIKNWNYEKGIMAIKHRGPDAQRVKSYDDCTLAFARLAIMDLSMTAMQPMESEDGEVVLAYNGEIYGFAKLRQKLSKKYNLKTTSDTEVILYAYIEYGDLFVEYIDGMFAIAIYDRRQAIIKLYRDRCGIKPLYYYYDEGKFAFSSELKALVAAAGTTIKLEIDNTAIYDYLHYGYIPEPKSMYKKIYKLEPANKIFFHLKEKKIIEKGRYWRLHVNAKEDGRRNQKELQEELRNLLAESVKEQMVADVSVGTYLSGGIDSSIITYESHRENENIRAFSMGFEDKKYNEIRYAKLLADTFSIDQRIKYFTKEDYLKLGGLLKQLYDEPYADTSAYPTYLLSKFAREEVTVVLTGDGGDELFGGYGRYLQFDEKSGIGNKNNYTIEQIATRILAGDKQWGERVKEILQTDLSTYCRFIGMEREPEYEEIHEMLKLAKDYDPQWYLKKYYVKDLPPITRMRYLDFKTYLVSDILTKVDRASMSVSLETRVPFLSRKIVEFAFGLAANECCRNRELKGILKEAYQGIIPSDVMYRIKKGFSIPRYYVYKAEQKKELFHYIWKNEWDACKG